MLVDTHCHLYFNAFSGRESELASNMRAAGVCGALLVGISSVTNAEAAALASRSAEAGWGVRLEYSAGLHPAEPFEADCFGTAGRFDAQRYLAAQLQGDRRPIAIGECGIDLYWKRNPIEQQAAAFRAQLELGRELGLPVVVHTRDADSETLDVIESVPGSFGVLHCFNGSPLMTDYVLAGFARGGRWYASFAGNLTLGNRKLEAAARRLPLARLLVETDAPFMAPRQAREGLPGGARPQSEPAHVRFTFEHLCTLRGESPSELESRLFENSQACFGVNWQLS